MAAEGSSLSAGRTLNRDIMCIDPVGLTEQVWRRVEVFCTGEKLVYEANIETESCISASGPKEVNMKCSMHRV